VARIGGGGSGQSGPAAAVATSAGLGAQDLFEDTQVAVDHDIGPEAPEGARAAVRDACGEWETTELFHHVPDVAESLVRGGCL
jgi:hypothetical protein